MKLARAPRQMLMLDVPPRYRLNSNATARNAYGAAAQEIVCAALELEPIPINGNCEACFDAEDSAGSFYEIKSVHQSAKVVLYDCRLAKEERAGVPLTYAVLCHRLRRERDGQHVFAGMAEGGLEILLLRAGTVREYAARETLRTMKSASPDPRNGYSRKGYRDGYRNLAVKKLREVCAAWKCRTFSLHGVEFEIPIFAE